MSNHSETMKAAKAHMIERHKGIHKVDQVKANYNRKEVNCVMCGRQMTTTRVEKHPYYCYKCHDEAEGVFGL